MMATNTMRWVKTLLILFTVLALCSTMASAATTVEISPSSKTVVQGETFTVSIQVTPDRPLRGAQVDLSYGDSLLGSASATDGAMFDNFVQPTTGTGTLSLISGYQMPSEDTVSTQGNLATVQFTASSTNAGTTQLDLSTVKVKDENGDPLPAEDVTVIGGTVTVTEAGSTTTVVKIVPQSKTVVQGETFTVSIQVTPDRPLRGAQVDLSYGDSLLGSASATDGAMFDNFVQPTTGTGTLSLISGYQMPSEDTVSTQGNLATVQFTASSTNAGTTQLDLSTVKVKDENGDPLPAEDVTVIGGTVTVTTNVPPTVTVTYPVSGTVSGTIDVTADADDDPDGTVTQVAFYLMPAETLIGTDTNDAGGWSVSLDTTTVDNGDYQIKAVATDDEGATGENTGNEFAIDNGFCLQLNAGWNLVSVPKTIDGTNDAKTIFEINPTTETCEYYDACADDWLALGDIDVMPCRGYWVYKVNSVIICVDLETGTGIPPAQQLCEGWNMIGHIDTSVMPIDDGTNADFGSLTGLEGNFAQIWQWTQDSGWECCYPSGINYMTPGQGYWIYMTEDGKMAGMP